MRCACHVKVLGRRFSTVGAVQFPTLDIHEPKDLVFQGFWFREPQITGFWNPHTDVEGKGPKHPNTLKEKLQWNPGQCPFLDCGPPERAPIQVPC